MNFLIVGLIRNCEDDLLNTLICLNNSFKFADRLEYYFVESDSNDETLSKLEELKHTRENLNFISLGKLSEKFPIRVERLAYCRNKYIEYLWQKNNDWVNYLVVVDMDGVCTDLTEEAVKSCWDKEEWAACTANQSDYYYDIWALRHSSWCPNDFGIAQRENLKIGFDESYLTLNLYSMMIDIPSSFDFIKVGSAFSGLAIYKKSFIPKDARYTARDENNEIICDHPTFNKYITDAGGEIYINPKLIIGKIPQKFYSGINYYKFITRIFRITKAFNSILNQNKFSRLLKKFLRKLSKSY